MPLELGLFLGAKYLGTSRQKDKNALIMDSDRYRYQKFISDIAGQDIKAHDNNIEKVIKMTRNWIKAFSPDETVSGSEKIFEHFNKFEEEKPSIMEMLELSVNDDITFADYLSLISLWQRVPSDISG